LTGIADTNQLWWEKPSSLRTLRYSERRNNMSDTSADSSLNQSSTLIADRSALHSLQFGLVPQLVAAQATIWPDAIAAVHGKALLTYKELNQRADRLACFLQSLGVGPDVVVGIHLNRSLAMVVAALAVMKAGGAYLPLDPNYPSERLTFMLNDARTPVLITAECLRNVLPARPGQIVILDSEGRFPGEATPRPATANPEAGNLAYLIYTSGSTGQPKGVEITHRSLSNLVAWHRRAFRVGLADRASQLAALGFDAAVWEIWPYLTAGARIHLAGAVAVNEPVAVRDWLLSEGITISFLPTPLAEQVMTLEWPAKSGLRLLLTGADTLHHYPPRKLPFVLVNNYGPTECAVVATSGTVLPDEQPDRLPSIGRPIDNVQIFILNERMQQVPLGESGEICIGGAGLARGYRNRPDLTAERFVHNPFSLNPDGRLYKTGDVGRYLPDGQIEFLGRADDQIKIRGFRIEPAEIVRVLDEHPAVRASIVVPREIAPGDKRLVAYFVPAAKANPTHTELRNAIAARLPEYMLPSAFVKVETLPLNTSGKVDRGALPAPTSENTLRDDTFVAPRTPVEERLASMLAPLLGLDKVSAEDNFFLLGGHSLLGTQLIARVRDAFGVELTLRALFDAPTVSKLSAQVERLLLARLEAMSEAEAERLLAITTPVRT
jgi:amino acid adenylation domain-containing protein